ncbi:glucose 1-dehydrogenase [Tropicimonas isoalkanivorans]|uniref:3-oxoacyl-[acyl-carrier protein] reductase n=1 Tax=Tropicimonas isoalkanivorans TaxID=441112 RepID=A0A1I1FVD1_9RHOB|nr:glucose 1-dehydrogenase [Tropicimonas isoalkanivorans]SFC03407.1 3-oxoacyl-[acyl-carrier protein] reductase [Tropicimonas isoalkanivorans]
MRLEGKSAIITGGGSGFGAGIARKFAAEGARVMIADINIETARAVAEEVGGIAQFTDVAFSGSVKDMAEEAISAFGKVDILINNAGITHRPGPLEGVAESDFDKVLAVNTKSIFLTAKYLVPHMKAAGAGAILNVASTAGISPRPNLNWYNASKGWVITATRTMAVELAPAGVRVNALAPVAGETPLLAAFMGEDTPEMREKFLSTIPIGRFSTPEDIGNAACYLCSDEASMITGSVLKVDGGRCI